MRFEDTERALHAFGKYVVQQSRTRLTKGNHNASKHLYDSIDFEVKSTNNGYELSFFALPYGEFLDKGVSGKKHKYDTPYSYKNKMPPPKAFEAWIKAKGIKYRDDKGRFKKGGVKTLSFLIARSVFNNGIKPSLFFTKPFEKAFERFPDDIADNLAQDIIDNI